ncbi:MoaB/Mog domain-containing protein [Phycomyces nitens]|nr:MoaB/Mog domain-containing protein [Phycomyces nitens]
MSSNNSFTAACCIIGDEILNGKTRDSNAHFLARSLFDLGVDLKRVETIPDDYEAIAETIRRLSSQHDIVFTSGGIGPTHDDITYAALAKAYNLPLELDLETCKQMEEKSGHLPGWVLNDARKRMAIFPKPSTLIRTSPELWVPIVVVNENIHVLPGIPRLFERLFESLQPHILSLIEAKTGKQGTEKYHRIQIATAQPEGKIADCLTAAQERVKDGTIKIGSYPKWGQDSTGARVVVSIVGKDKKAVETLASEISNEIEGWIHVPK